MQIGQIKWHLTDSFISNGFNFKIDQCDRKKRRKGVMTLPEFYHSSDLLVEVPKQVILDYDSEQKEILSPFMILSKMKRQD